MINFALDKLKSLQPKSCYCETTIGFIQCGTPPWRQKIAQWGQIFSYLHTYLRLIHEILTHRYRISPYSFRP